MKRLLLALLIFCTASTGWSDALRDRMKARAPELEALKAAQKAGENKDGYLTAFDAADAVKQLVSAENVDRRTAYERIAAKTGSSAEVVGRLRAEQLRKLVDPGERYEQADGTWVVKQ